jgi:hypothetical protein
MAIVPTSLSIVATPSATLVRSLARSDTRSASRWEVRQRRLAEVFPLGHALLLTPFGSAESTDIKLKLTAALDYGQG